MRKPVRLRANQRDGYISELYAEASSNVENIKRIAERLRDDEVRHPELLKMYRETYNLREQARSRLDPLEEVEDELYTPEILSPEEIKTLTKQREKLVGEIFVRIYNIHLVSRRMRNVLGA